MKQTFKKLLLFSYLMALLSANSFSQGFTENFDDGDLSGWGGQPDYVLTNMGTELQIVSDKVSIWNSFTFSFTPTDISANPYISIKVKTDIDLNLNFSVWDNLVGDNYAYPVNHAYVEIVHSDSYSEYTFDFSGISGVDLTSIHLLNFVFNPNGAMTCHSTVFFDDIQIGDVALKMPAITNIQDQYHVMNATAVTVPFWGVRPGDGGAISITATSSNTGLIPNPTVTYTSSDATGTLSYTPTVNQAGIATITVIVSEPGMDDNIMTFDVNVETNIAPTINQAANVNIVAGTQTDVIIAGLADGNPNDNQDLSIMATSSDTSIVPNPIVVYTVGDFETTLELNPILGQTGIVTITLTVQDDGGTINGGVDTEEMTFNLIVYEDVNNSPTMHQPADVSILSDEPEQTINLIDITDGDDSKIQGITITATSSNPSLIPDPTLVYSSGLNSGKLLFTSVASQTGTTTITVTLTDDGGAGNNNGNEATVYTFNIEVRVAPIIGWSDDFEDGILGSQWPATWGSPGEDAHQCTESGGEMEIEIDKTRNNNKWSGTWFNIPDELDLSDNPYISIRMRVAPGNVGTAPNDMHIFLWDAYDHYNTAKTIRHTVTTSYVEYYFDYSDPSYQLQGDGTVVDISRIKALLFNFDPGGNTPLLEGSFYFDDLRIGDQANTLPITPQVSMDTIANYAVIQDAGEQTITITGLTDGADNSAAVSLAVVSSNTTVIPTPVASAVSSNSATLTYTPDAGQTGTSTITVTASAAGSISNVQSFTIDVVQLTPSTADDIIIDLTTEYQEIDGFGVKFNRSKGGSTDTTISLAEDLGISMVRISIISGGFEEINDNSDPYIINLDAYNPDAFAILDIRRLAPFVDKFILTIGSPAGWLKTNKTEEGVHPASTDNHLEPRHYEEFAEEIIAAVKMIKRETGVDIYAIGLQNEPEFNEPYASCQIGWNEYRDILKVVGKRLDDEGLSNVKLFFADALPAQNHLDEYIDAVKNDPIAEGYADIASLHNYDADGIHVGGAGCSEWQDFYTWATTGGTGSQYKTWMTETSGHANNWDGAINLAGNIFNALECGNVSAWLFLALNTSSGSSAYGLTVSGTPSARFFVSKQYYKFIRPGAIRVDATSAGIPSLAFKDDDAGTVTVILFNNTTSAQAIEIGGANLPSQWESYTTSDRRNCEKGLDVGADGLIILPPSSLTTLVGYSNVPPTVDPIADELISQDSPAQIVSLTGLSDGDAGAQTLVITVSSDNQSLIPDPVITYTNGDVTGTLTYTPTAALSGSATITVTLTDDGSPVGITTEEFVINVVSVNNIPTVDAISDVTIDEDAGLEAVNLTGISDGDGGSQVLTISVSGYDAGLIGVPVVNYVNGNATGSITFTPLTDANGTTTVTVTLQDDGGTANGTDTYVTNFDVTVNAVNDEPVITLIANQNAAPSILKTINLSGITNSDPETQAITITATSSATGIVPDPTINYTSDDATGTLTFTPLSLGTATITVTVQDDGGTANSGDNEVVITFDVEVTATVNENPTIDAIGDMVVNYSASEQTVDLTGIADGDAALTQTITITATSSNTGLIPDPAITYTSDDATGTLNFTPVTATSGTATITVTVSDDGSPVASTIEQFDVTVSGINLTPTLNAITTPGAVLEDNSGTITVNLSNITDGGDGGQNLTVTATEVTPTGNLLTNLSVTYTSPANIATVSYEALPDINGDAVIYITVKDDGGTGSGAIDSIRLQFIQTITAVNDQPLCDAIADVTLEAGITHAVLLTGVDDADVDLTQTITVTAIADNLDLIPNIIYSGASKVLTFSIPEGVSGTTTITVTISDDGGTANGGIDALVLTFDVSITTVGVSENAQNTILLYPNPATSFINVRMYENTFNTMIVTDIVGRIMTSVDLSGITKEYKLDVSQYSKGSYMITLVNDSGKYSGRFIVE